MLGWVHLLSLIFEVALDEPTPSISTERIESVSQGRSDPCLSCYTIGILTTR